MLNDLFGIFSRIVTLTPHEPKVMSMRIYVASKFENKVAVRAAMTALRKAGHVITFDWTPFEVQPEGTLPEVARDYEIFCASSDVEGARSCDAMVLLCHPKMQGAWVEVGIVLGRRQPIYLLDSHLVAGNIFVSLPEFIKAATIEDVIKNLADLSKTTTKR